MLRYFSILTIPLACSLLLGCGSVALKTNSPAAIANSAAKKLNLIPVYPLTSDLRPGDIFISVQPNESCQEKLDKIPDRNLLVKRIGRIKIAEIKAALIEDAKERLDTSILDTSTMNPPNTDGNYPYPIVAFPAFSFSSLFGDTFAVNAGVYGLGFNSQNSKRFDVSFKDVISIGLPALKMFDVIEKSKFVTDLGEPERIKQLKLEAQTIFNQTNEDSVCGDNDYKYALFLVNTVYAAKETNVTFSDGASFSALAKSHLTGLDNLVEKVKGKTAIAAKPAVDTGTDNAGVDPKAASKPNPNAVINDQLQAIDALTDGTPRVSNSIGFSENGEVSYKTLYTKPLIFGVGSVYEITIKENSTGKPAIVVLTPNKKLKLPAGVTVSGKLNKAVNPEILKLLDIPIVKPETP